MSGGPVFSKVIGSKALIIELSLFESRMRAQIKSLVGYIIKQLA
jgi:hypothetical protein